MQAAMFRQLARLTTFTLAFLAVLIIVGCSVFPRPEIQADAAEGGVCAKHGITIVSSSSEEPRSKLRGIFQGKSQNGGCCPQTPARHSSPQQAVGYPGFFP